MARFFDGRAQRPTVQAAGHLLNGKRKDTRYSSSVRRSASVVLSSAALEPPLPRTLPFPFNQQLKYINISLMCILNG